MPKRRWDRKKRRMQASGRRVASRRAETVEVYRDPETKLLLRCGPDHGPDERKAHDGGIVVGARVVGLAQTAWVVAPGALELLAHEGGLLVGADDAARRAAEIRRWIEAAETLRALATRAGVQKRLTGRYDFGAVGRGEMSERAVQAFDRLTALAERLTWGRLGPLIDLVLFETLPPGLRYPTVRALPVEGDAEFPAYLAAAKHNPAYVVAMARAVAEAERLLPGRVEAWRTACLEVQALLDRLADAFGLRLPQSPH